MHYRTKSKLEDVAVPFKRSWLGLLPFISKLEFPSNNRLEDPESIRDSFWETEP